MYPVKSCRGTALAHARLTERGLEHDREWMVVDRAGRLVTQREAPRLALVVPALTASVLELAAPGVTATAVPLGAQGAWRRVSVWRDTVSAIDQGDEAAAWLSAWLAREVRLVRFDPQFRRICDPAYAGASGAHTAFADGYPLLILSEASLVDLNRRLASPLPMNRFRPNLVLSDVEAYDEDQMSEIAVGVAKFKPVKPCTRCRITTTDQATAEVGIEPLPTLALYRHDSRFDGVAFGMNAIVVSGAGTTIAVGERASCALNFTD